jgi:hypothetical protein
MFGILWFGSRIDKLPKVSLPSVATKYRCQMSCAEPVACWAPVESRCGRPLSDAHLADGHLADGHLGDAEQG